MIITTIHQFPAKNRKYLIIYVATIINHNDDTSDKLNTRYYIIPNKRNSLSCVIIIKNVRKLL